MRDLNSVGLKSAAESKRDTKMGNSRPNYGRAGNYGYRGLFITVARTSSWEDKQIIILTLIIDNVNPTDVHHIRLMYTLIRCIYVKYNIPAAKYLAHTQFNRSTTLIIGLMCVIKQRQ